MIETVALTKRFGSRLAVDGLSCTVRPGLVTGFLGPNGAGKSTTMRMILGLDRPTSGTVTVRGVPYRQLRWPLREVGSLLDEGAAHRGRTARNHLLALARSNRIPAGRVGRTLSTVGLAAVADRRVGTYSLGMRQRLGLAAALLGDPAVLILDEPTNGLDTDGIRWLRGLLRDLAAEGRTILLSSHVMTELELSAEHLIVLSRGRVLADAPMREFIERHSEPVVTVRSQRAAELGALLERHGGRLRAEPPDGWLVTGLDTGTIGAAAATAGIAVHELTARHSSLEDVYTRLTAR